MTQKKSINGKTYTFIDFNSPPTCSKLNRASCTVLGAEGTHKREMKPRAHHLFLATSPTVETIPGQFQDMEDLHRSVWPAVRPPAHKWLAQQWRQNQQPSCYKSIVFGSPTRTGETLSITAGYRLLVNSLMQLTGSLKNKAQMQDVESQFLSVSSRLTTGVFFLTSFEPLVLLI